MLVFCNLMQYILLYIFDLYTRVGTTYVNVPSTILTLKCMNYFSIYFRDLIEAPIVYRLIGADLKGNFFR